MFTQDTQAPLASGKPNQPCIVCAQWQCPLKCTATRGPRLRLHWQYCDDCPGRGGGSWQCPALVVWPDLAAACGEIVIICLLSFPSSFCPSFLPSFIRSFLPSLLLFYSCLHPRVRVCVCPSALLATGPNVLPLFASPASPCL